jgi:hypothetical protein
LPENKESLHNTDHKVAEGIYVAGTRDGEASFIAAGSGAAVATDILTLE